MASADSRVIFATELDSSGVKDGLNKLQSGVSGLAVGVGTALGNIGATVLSNIVTTVANSYQQWIDTASDLQEVQNVVDTTFGESAAVVNEWATEAKNAYGMSELKAKQYSSTMGAMLKSMGLTDTATVKMSTSMAGLAGDMASFYNLDYDTAFEKIRAGISGETEPLKQLGINMSVANLEAYAMSEGIETSYDKMTQAQQATLRYNYILAATADAQGDFARTSDGYANQQRILATTQEELAATLGEMLLPAAVAWTQTLIGMVEGLKSAATWVDNLLHPSKSELDQEIDDAKTSLASLKREVADAGKNLDTTMDAAKTTQATALSLLANYEEIQSKNVLTDADVAQLQTIAGNIVKLYPEMGAAIDETTGLFDTSTDAVRNNINALADQAFIAAQTTATQQYTQALMDAAVAEDKAKKAHADAYADFVDKQTARVAAEALGNTAAWTTDYVNQYAAQFYMLDGIMEQFFETNESGAIVLSEMGEQAVGTGDFLNVYETAMVNVVAAEDQAKDKSYEMYNALVERQEATAEATEGMDAANIACLKYKDSLLGTTTATDDNTTATDKNTKSKWTVTDQTGKHTAVIWQNTEAVDGNTDSTVSMSEATGEAADATVEQTDAMWGQYEATEAQTDAQGQNTRGKRSAASASFTAAQAAEREAKAIEDAKEKMADLTEQTDRNIGSTVDGFGKVSKVRTQSAKTTLTNLKQQKEYMDTYSANLKTIGEMGFSDEVIAAVSDGTAESAAVVAGLIKAKEDQVAQINELYTANAEQKADMAETLAADQAKIDEATATMADTSEAASASVQNSAESTAAAIDAAATAGEQSAADVSAAATATQTAADDIAQDKADALTTVTELTEEVPSVIDGAGSALRRSGAEIIAYIAAGVYSNNAAKNAVKTNIMAAANAAKGIASSEGYSVGNNLMRGIQSGLNGMLGSLTATMRSIVMALLRAAQNAAGVRSPSTLFRDQLGRYLAEGVGDGYTRTMQDSVIPSVAASMATATEAAQQALDNTLIARVQRVTGASLPNVGALTDAIMRGSAIEQAAGAVTNTSQTTVDARQYVTFENPVQAPDEVARAMKRIQMHGLAANR